MKKGIFMNQLAFNLIVMGFLALTTVACDLSFQGLHPTQVDYILDSTCDRNTVTYLSNKELPALQEELDQPSNYRLTLARSNIYNPSRELIELVNIGVEIRIGDGAKIDVIQFEEDFVNNRPQQAAVRLQRMDGTENDTDVNVHLVHQELDDDIIAASFLISDRESNCEDFLDVSILREGNPLVSNHAFMMVK